MGILDQGDFQGAQPSGKNSISLTHSGPDPSSVGPEFIQIRGAVSYFNKEHKIKNESKYLDKAQMLKAAKYYYKHHTVQDGLIHLCNISPLSSSYATLFYVCVALFSIESLERTQSVF